MHLQSPAEPCQGLRGPCRALHAMSRQGHRQDYCLCQRGVPCASAIFLTPRHRSCFVPDLGHIEVVQRLSCVEQPAVDLSISEALNGLFECLPVPEVSTEVDRVVLLVFSLAPSCHAKRSAAGIRERGLKPAQWPTLEQGMS